MSWPARRPGGRQLASRARSPLDTRRLRLLLLSCSLAACPAQKGGAPTTYAQDFAAPLGPEWLHRGGSWRVVAGALSTLGDHNQPLFLDVPLAKNTRVEVTMVSHSNAVDMKLELFGDGVRHESGYIVIFGGWNNTISCIAKLDEHQAGRKELKRKWEKDRRYRVTVQRLDGHTLEVFVDGERVMAYDDKAPLFGPGNDRLAFTSWESEVEYDDLVITPLP